MRFYIVGSQKYKIENDPKKLPIEQMLKDLCQEHNLKAFTRFNDAVQYRSSLNNGGRAQKIIFTQTKTDCPIFTVDTTLKLGDLKKQILPKGLLQIELNFYEIKPSDIVGFVYLNLGYHKDLQLRNLYDLPTELLIKIADSNLSLADLGNLAQTHSKFHQLLSSNNPQVEKFWTNKVRVLYPFEFENSQGVKSLRSIHQQRHSQNYHFQWILDRAKEGDLSAFIKFNFERYSHLIYSDEDHLSMTVLDWLKHYKHTHILDWLYTSRNLQNYFKILYTFKPSHTQDNFEIFYAVCLNQADVLQKLIFENKIDLSETLLQSVKIRNKDRLNNHTLLGIAVSLSSYDIVKLILQNDNTGALTEDLLKRTSTLQNFQFNTFEICEILLELYQSDEIPKMLIHYAARNKDTRVLKLALKADPKKINEIRDFPVVRRVKTFDYHPRTIWNNGTFLTPLFIACYLQNPTNVKLLLESGANIDELVEEMTALHFVAKHGLSEMVKLLLSYKANPLIQTGKGVVPLHLAAKSGSLACVKEFIDYFTQNNLVQNLSDLNKNDNSVLHYAAKFPQILQLLLHSGIDINLINAVNKDGKLPMTIALKAKCKASIAIFYLNSTQPYTFDKQDKDLQKIYTEVCNLVTTLQSHLANINTPNELVLAGLKWYLDQGILSGYFWLEDKPLVRTIIKYLESHIATMTTLELISYLEENLKPSNKGNELSIIKVVLTHCLYNKIEKTQAHNSGKEEEDDEKKEVKDTLETNQSMDDDLETRRLKLLNAAMARLNEKENTQTSDEESGENQQFKV